VYEKLYTTLKQIRELVPSRDVPTGLIAVSTVSGVVSSTPSTSTSTGARSLSYYRRHCDDEDEYDYGRYSKHSRRRRYYYC
jgi:hypothetical protein